MALIKTPDGGFYVNDDEFEVNYSTNSISLTGQGGGGVAGVSSFNGRTGAVVPQDGDYTAEQVGAASTDTVNTMSEYIHDIVEGVEPLPYLPETYTPPIATANSVGTIKPGTGMEVTADGTLNCTVAPGTSGITQEQADDRYLQLSGGTMTGALNMGANKITTTTTPTETSDVTNKGYVDGVVRVVSDEVDGIIAGTTSISVPIATDVKVGGVKIGAGLSIDGEGTLTTAQTYLSTQGGTLEANASITGEDAMTFEVPDSTESATVGITAQGVTITHNTNSDVDSSIRAIDNAIEIKANDTTVTINGTGVALGGAAISGINSLAGQSSNEIAIESNVDMNSHNLTNVGEISTSG